MRETLSIGPCPCDEDAVQVEPTGAYVIPMRAQCARFQRLLMGAFPNAQFRIARNAHDFGAYYEVEAVYDTNDEAQAEAAFNAEAQCPATWAELEAMAKGCVPQ